MDELLYQVYARFPELTGDRDPLSLFRQFTDALGGDLDGELILFMRKFISNQGFYLQLTEYLVTADRLPFLLRYTSSTNYPLHIVSEAFWIFACATTDVSAAGILVRDGLLDICLGVLGMCSTEEGLAQNIIWTLSNLVVDSADNTRY
jgi:hypothetical protein